MSYNNSNSSLTDNSSDNDNYIDLATGQPANDLLPLDDIKQAFNQSINNNEQLNYGAESGEHTVKQCVINWQACIHNHCNHYRHNNNNVTNQQCHHIQYSTDNITICSGVSHGIDVVITALTQANDVVFIDSPSYFLTFNIFKQHNLHIHNVDINIDYNLSFYNYEQLEQDIIRCKPSLFYVIPLHHNPIGGTMTQQDMLKLINLANKYNFIILSDEVYYSLTYQNRYTKTIYSFATIEYDNEHNDINESVVILSSVSKTLSPAIRLGWILANKQNTLLIQQNAVLLSGTQLSKLSGYAIEYMLCNHKLYDNIDKLCNIYERRLYALMYSIDQYLHEFKYLPCFGGYFLYLILPHNNNITSLQLREYCLTHYNLKLKPAIHCVYDKSISTTLSSTSHTIKPEYCIRLCFAQRNEHEIEQGIQRLAIAYKQLCNNDNNIPTNGNTSAYN